MKSIQRCLTCICLLVVFIPSAALTQQPPTFQEIAVFGHGNLLATAWSPNAQIFAVSGGQQGIWVYDKSFREISHLTGRSGTWLTWKSDGKQLATANIKVSTWVSDKVAYVWDVASGKQLFALEQPDEAIYAVTWTPDETRLITRGEHSLQIWDATSGTLLRQFSNINGGHELSWSPDGKHILTSGGERVDIWNADGFPLGFDFTTLSIKNHAAWSPDGQKIAITSAYAQLNQPDAALNALQIRDAHSGKLISTMQSGYADSVAWSPDGRVIATGGGVPYFELKLWDALTGTLLSDQFVHHGSIHTVTWASDNSLLTASTDNTLRLWQFNYDKLLGAAQPPRIVAHSDLLQGYSGPLTAIAWSPDGKQLATGSWDGAVRTWNVSKQLPLFTFSEHSFPVYSVAWNAESTRLAESGFDGNVNIWNTYTGAKLCSFSANTGTNNPSEGFLGGVTLLAWSPDDQYLASAGYDGKVDIWEVRNSCAERVHQWTISQHFPVSLLFWSLDGQHLIVSDNTSIRSYSVTSGQLINSFPTEGRILALAKSPDGLHIALLRDNGETGQSVEFRDAATFQTYLTAQRPSCEMNRPVPLIWSPDSQQLAGICRAYKIIIWDTHTGKTVFDTSANVATLTWSPDGQQVATADIDGIIRLWVHQQ